MIARQGLGEHDRRHLRRPEPTAAQLVQPRAITGQRTEPACVEHERHPARLARAVRPSPALPNARSAQARASDVSLPRAPRPHADGFGA